MAAVGTDEQTASIVQPGEGAFDDPAVAAESGAVSGLAPRDRGLDASPPDEAAVRVVVVAAVSDDAVGTASGPADSTAYRWHAVDQRE
jgi:hypothetical protein